MTKAEAPATLLGVAGRLFREHGYAATSVREISAAAGILPGSLHYRFATKDSILRTLMESGMTRALAEVRSAIEPSADPVERLRLAIRAHLRLLVEGDDAVYVLLYELRSLTADERAAIVHLRDAYDALWTGLLYAAVGSGQARTSVDIKVTRLMVLGALNWTAQWYRRDGGQSVDEVADGYHELLMKGISPR